MKDIYLMILSALGAVAGAIAILAVLCWLGGAFLALFGGAVGVVVKAAPVLICFAGVAYAAAKTGY